MVAKSVETRRADRESESVRHIYTLFILYIYIHIYIYTYIYIYIYIYSYIYRERGRETSAGGALLDGGEERGDPEGRGREQHPLCAAHHHLSQFRGTENRNVEVHIERVCDSAQSV